MINKEISKVEIAYQDKQKSIMGGCQAKVKYCVKACVLALDFFCAEG